MSVASLSNIGGGLGKPNDINPNKIQDTRYQIYVASTTGQNEVYSFPVYGWNKVALCLNDNPTLEYAFILNDGTITTYQSISFTTDVFTSYMDIPAGAVQISLRCPRQSRTARLYYSLIN